MFSGKKNPALYENELIVRNKATKLQRKPKSHVPSFSFYVTIQSMCTIAKKKKVDKRDRKRKQEPENALEFAAEQNKNKTKNGTTAISLYELLVSAKAKKVWV